MATYLGRRAPRVDLYLEQGADFAQPLVYRNSDGTPVDLTGYTAAAQVRKSVGSATVALALTVTLGADGAITLSAPAAATEAVAIDKGVWDLELTAPGGAVTRLLSGDVIVDKGVTRG